MKTKKKIKEYLSGIALGTILIFLLCGTVSALSNEGDSVQNVVANTWTNMNPTMHPSVRQSSAMVYNSEGDKSVLFGGLYEPPWTPLEDTWVYNFSSNIWMNMNPTIHPSARYGHGMAYDSESDRIIIFGGWNTWSIDETWAYDLKNNSWTNMNPVIHPPIRTGGQTMMTYDIKSDRIILFGGQADGGGTQPYDDTWAYDYNTNTWINMNPATHPTARTGQSMTYDLQSDKVILFGGSSNANGIIYYNDTWAYDFDTNIWINMNPIMRPSERCNHMMTYDSQSDSVILFGGNNQTYDVFNDTWAYDYNKNTWRNLNPEASPSARIASAISYDSESDKIILFGGGVPYGNQNNETWAYTPPHPGISISTDKLQYSPGDTMTVTLSMSNPTNTQLKYEWYIIVPQKNRIVTYAKAPLPAGYDATQIISIPVSNWFATPVSLIHFVHILDDKGKVLAQDAASVVFDPASTVNSIENIEDDLMKIKH